MKRPKTKILLISASAKTGGGPSHIFLLKKILKDEFDFYLAMPFLDPKIQNYNKKKYLQISERRISFIDILRLSMAILRNTPSHWCRHLAFYLFLNMRCLGRMVPKREAFTHPSRT